MNSLPAFPPYALKYFVEHGYGSMPDLLENALQGVTEADLDKRPYPERFTLREVVCHLADWEPIWLERMTRMVSEDKPVLPGYDEGQMVIDNDYAHQDLATQLARFRTGRAAMVAFLKTREEADWNRIGVRQEVGEMTLLMLSAMILGHDLYHLKQIQDYRGL
jgi:uncharacterized damage-inducible protein DinB